MQKMLTAAICLALMLTVALPTAARQQTFNVGLGLGFANGIERTLPGGALIGTLKTGHMTIATRIAYFSEIQMNMGFGSTGPATNVRDLALMLGLSTGYVNGTSATIEVGLGLATANWSRREWGENDYSDREVTASTAGLAVQSQLYARRLGLVLFANLNKQNSFGGALLCLRIGRCN